MRTGTRTKPAAIFQAPHHLHFDLRARAKQEMTPDALAGPERLGGEGRAAGEPVGQQQGLLGQTRQQAQGEFPLRLALVPDGGRQGIVQSQFQEHAGADLGEGGAPAPRLGLAQGGVILRGVGHTVLGAIQRGQQPTAPKGLRVATRAGQRTEHPLHQFRENLPGQTRPAITTSAVAERILKEHRKMCAQRAGGVHDVKDQGGQQTAQGHARLASATLWDRGQNRCPPTSPSKPPESPEALMGAGRGAEGWGCGVRTAQRGGGPGGFRRWTWIFVV